MQLEEYLEVLGSKVPKSSVDKTRVLVEDFVSNTLEEYDFNSHVRQLLLGHVQSGKTSQMMAILAATNDFDTDAFKIFLVVTTDNVSLQSQTFKRFFTDLSDFTVLDERDQDKFRLNFTDRVKPKACIIVLKKNGSVLKSWADEFASVQSKIQGNPVFILDDEADASSLDTRINDDSVESSTINDSLRRILSYFSASIYLQVTATPQAILLQCSSNDSALRPSRAYSFAPGEGYLGGDFFYSSPPAYTHKTVGDEEGDQIHETQRPTSSYLESIVTFIIVSAYQELLSIGPRRASTNHVCNFLVHPGLETNRHDSFKNAAEHGYKNIVENISKYYPLFETVWRDLQQHKPEILPLDRIIKFVESDEYNVSFRKLNMSTPEGDRDYSTGNNIIIGGNSLGRGVTFPALQVVYYTRHAKTAQVDTIWQHCRMFGYDRDRDLMRVFMPIAMYRRFSEVNESTEALFECIRQNPGLKDIVFATPVGTRATRNAVVDRDATRMFPGGRDIFPRNPVESDPEKIDIYLKKLGLNDGENLCDIDDIVELLNSFEDSGENYFSIFDYASTLASWAAHSKSGTRMAVNIRRDRNVAKGTGSLLSPTDRALSQSVEDMPVLTLYRLTGKSRSLNPENQWTKATPFWVPNIRMPKGRAYYLTPVK